MTFNFEDSSAGNNSASPQNAAGPEPTRPNAESHTADFTSHRSETCLLNPDMQGFEMEGAISVMAETGIELENMYRDAMAFTEEYAASTDDSQAWTDATSDSSASVEFSDAVAAEPSEVEATASPISIPMTRSKKNHLKNDDAPLSEEELRAVTEEANAILSAVSAANESAASERAAQPESPAAQSESLEGTVAAADQPQMQRMQVVEIAAGEQPVTSVQESTPAVSQTDENEAVQMQPQVQNQSSTQLHSAPISSDDTLTPEEAKALRKAEKKKRKREARAALALAGGASPASDQHAGNNDMVTAKAAEPVTKATIAPAANDSSTATASSSEAAAVVPVATLPTADQVLFRDLPLSNEVQLAVEMTGYIAPTPVQAEIIPYMLDRRDVVAQSQTGTGKTAAFALPILSHIDIEGSMPQVLVLAPTRELALQVAKAFEAYGACMPKLRVTAIYGGADYEPQLRALRRGVHVVVGTPGRVIDHIKRGSLKLDAINCLVLDEADEMLNMGFIEDVEFVLANSRAERQVALFSATMPEPIRRIADKYLNDPATVTIHKKTLTADSITQKCVFVNERSKLDLLARLLEIEKTDGVIVFTKTKDSTVAVADQLTRLGFGAAALNGDLPQARRQRTVDQLKSGHLDIIVATDVAARGLDVQRISHVFNYDMPHDSESYVHRIGRTGRAGRDGAAYIFLTPQQRGKLRLIENVTRKSIEIIQAPTAEEINDKRMQEFKSRILAAASDKRKLRPFNKLIAECISEADLPAELIASAIALVAQGDRPLFVEDLPELKVQSYAESKGKFGRERGERGEGRGRDDGRPPRRRALREGMRRYRVEVGSSDGVRPGNIVGAIANEAGIAGSDIGSIDIRIDHSFVDLPEDVTKETVQQLMRTWVAGKQLQIRPAGAEESGPGGGGGKFSRGPNRGAGGPGRKPFKSFKAGKKSRGPNKFAAEATVIGSDKTAGRKPKKSKFKKK